MKNSIVGFADRVLPGVTDRLRARRQRARTPEELDVVEALREEVRELRAEIDECRRDSLRIAELTDVVEQRLSSPTSD